MCCLHKQEKTTCEHYNVLPVVEEPNRNIMYTQHTIYEDEKGIVNRPYTQYPVIHQTPDSIKENVKRFQYRIT